MSSGSFNTQEIRKWSDPQQKNFKSFITKYPAGNFPIGLNMLDVAGGTNVRVRAYADNVSPADSNFDSFKADFHTDSWGDTCLYTAGCSWLDVSKHSTNFQFGKFSSGTVATGSPKTLKVTFKRPYDSVPKVAVWLRTLDLDGSKTLRIRAYASSVTTAGFELEISTWLGSVVNDAEVSWIAVPSDRSGMTAGQFTTAGRPPTGQRPSFSTRFIFDKPFRRTPRVITALNMIDVLHKSNLRIKTYAKDITPEGMTLVIDTWGDTTLYGAAAAFIALEDFDNCPVMEPITNCFELGS